MVGSSPLAMVLANKRVLIVVNELWFFLSHRLPIGVAAVDAGYKVHVASRIGSEDEIAQLSAAGIVFHPIPLQRSSSNPWDEWNTIRFLVTLYREIRPDLVHHVTIKPILYGTLAARLVGGIMVLNAISGLGFTFIANGMIAMFRRSLLVLFYRLLINSKVVWMLFQNPDDRDLFEQYGITYQGHAREIKGSGVDLTQFLPTPLPVGTPKVVLIARMLWDKGVGEFVESAKLIKQRGIEVQFLLVGSIDEGNPKSIPVEQLGEWTRSGHVDWLGSRSDIPQLLEESRIVVLPSYREGLPKTLIEAASAGRPIVTTDVPGCREVVQHGKNGILVSIRNAEQLADAIEKLIRDPELCRIMGRKGRQMAEQQFSVQRVVDETLDLYSELLS